MEIINNRNISNHEKNLLNYFKTSDEAILVSPFLSKSFNFFNFNDLKHLTKLTLITTLKKDYNDQHCKINFFKNLFDFGKKESVDIEILIDNSLHGKIYIFKKQCQFVNAIITSANFTSNGLKLNNEWGISFNDTLKIDNIAQDLISNIVLEPITKENLKTLEDELSLIPKPKNEIVNTNDLTALLSLKKNPLNISDKSNFWLKPIGSTGNYIPQNEKYDNARHKLHFSKFPRSIKIGDTLIAYAVGYKKIISIFKVVSTVEIIPDQNHRWRYYVYGENLTRYYGNEWNDHEIHISYEKNSFINETKLNATPSGKNSYGTLQRGGDKIRITKEFANYLINKIVDINKNISFRDQDI